MNERIFENNAILGKKCDIFYFLSFILKFVLMIELNRKKLN